MPAVIDAVDPRCVERSGGPTCTSAAAGSQTGAAVHGDLLQTDVAAAVLGCAAEAVDAPLPVR